MAQLKDLIVTGPSRFIGNMNINGACNNLITGSGTAAVDNGSGTTPRYIPAKWTFETGAAPVDGDIYTIKIPAAGGTGGVYMSVHGTAEANYYPIAQLGTGFITTHYGVGTTISVIFEADSICKIYNFNPTDNTTYNHTGCFRVINFYDSNTNTQMRVYREATNSEYPIISSRTKTASITNNSYASVYGIITGDDTKDPTINPSTGMVTTPGGLTISKLIGTSATTYGDTFPSSPAIGTIFFKEGAAVDTISITGGSGKAYVLGAASTSGNVNVTSNASVYTQGSVLYGACWNDYAEYRKDNIEEKDIQKPGQCVYELGDGRLSITDHRLMRGCEIISDTFGFAIGQDEERGYNTPIASNGRVLAYPYESIEEFAKNIGHAVCSGPNGTVSIMTDEEEEKYPMRALGTISEIPTYEYWGSGNVKVNGRIWIRIR